MTLDDSTLEQRLAAVLDSTEGIRREIRSENVKRDRRIRTNQRAIAAAIVAALIGLMVGIVGVKTARDANADRAANKVASCLQNNAREASQREAEIIQSHDLIAALVQTVPMTPGLAERVALYNDSHDALIRGEHKARDCTPAGIRRFFAPKR